ncbi:MULTISPECIES: tryptophan synthase subunit alpha [Halomonas]|uniref:Tryptophan synthase alpha chain n=1 Tax=Halomonas halophila TaxID=29573 RepID=A0ABQ0U3E8_9GAMM|nr:MULTISPECIES: tryptophan synthase subunit alpha [Halomonas]MDR5888559.1 tryptophan synthase subunit alpha [Halomonas salina]WJY07740.1 tryptophan synthase subunit alpha [Halomonas halophila]GEK72972.1 tryptophan synthase alpha chain [Halomonas halophila]
MTQRHDRIARRFDELKAADRAGLVTFISAGDPDYDTSLETLLALPEAGADVIELGMPFTDPMADGPSIQASTLRALEGGQTMARTLDMVRVLRERDDATPVVLMGYYNPIYCMGVEAFLAEAAEAGVDGLIVVDLPPEHDAELCLPAQAHGLDFIRLATPTTDARRLPLVLENTSGFLYYVSSTGVTGAAAPSAERVAQEVEAIRVHSDLPIGVGFGIRTPEQAERIARFADAVVVGSALTDTVAAAESPTEASRGVLELTRSLAGAVRRAREPVTQD